MGKSSRGIKSTFNANNFSTLALMSQNRKTTVKQVKHENTKKVSAVKQRSEICNFISVTIMSLIIVGIAIFVAYQKSIDSKAQMNLNCNKLVVFLIKNDTVNNVRRVFENLDYEIVDDINEKWNILWSVTQNPLLLFSDRMTKLKPHQLVNHIPSLSLYNIDNEFTSRVFQLPSQEFEIYIQKNPHKRFIVKDCLVDGKQVFDDVNSAVNSDASLIVQEYFDDENPLLIDDEYRFDFGVYVAISSVDPLRIYRYKGNVVSRFVSTKSATLKEKYFCEELSTPPSFNNTGYSMEAHLRKNGNNMTLIYQKIDSEIVKFLLKKLGKIKKPSNHFFQLLRFDFNFDSKMNIRMKNIESALDFELHERILYDTLKLIGASNFYEFKSRYIEKINLFLH